MKVGVPEDLAPQSIWTYYSQMQTALSMLRSQWPPSRPEPPVKLEGFQGMNHPEFEKTLADLRRHLDAQVTLALIATFEAMLRIDFINRTERRRPKDPVTKAFRALRKTEGLRPDLAKILDVHKTELRLGAAAGRFKQLFMHRHWLAHGRYWTDKSGIKPDPYEARAIGEALLSEIPTIGSRALGYSRIVGIV